MMNDGFVTMDDESCDAKSKSVCEKHDQNLLVALLGAGRMVWESQWGRTGDGDGDDGSSMIDVGSIDDYNNYGEKYC